MDETGTFSSITKIAQERVAFVDPHDCTDAKDELALLHAAFDTLVDVQGGAVFPRLAEAWSVSEDAKHWQFKIRDGVHFHDGTLCTAPSVALSLQRMARADKGYTLGAPGVWHQYLGDAEIEVRDPSTIILTLSEPLADLPDILAQGFIVAPAMIEQLDAGMSSLPCGTGPYRITSADAVHVAADKVGGHFRGGMGPSRVRWVREPDPIARQDLLLSGSVQVATDLPMVTEDQATSTGVTYHDYTNPVAIIYLMNAAAGPLADHKIRKALNMAIDRSALVANVLNGAANPLHGLMSPVSLGAGAVRELVDDLSSAHDLLTEAGYGDGLTLRLDCPTRLPDEAEALTAELARQLSPIGVALDVTVHTDREAYAHMVRRKEIGDLCVFDSSPLSTFRVLYEKIDSRVGGSWWQGYQNREAEAMLDQARMTVDLAKREALYAGIIALLQDDPPWLTNYAPLRRIGLGGQHPEFKMPSNGVLDVASLPTQMR